jgi:hypothetical protein
MIGWMVTTVSTVVIAREDLGIWLNCKTSFPWSTVGEDIFGRTFRIRDPLVEDLTQDPPDVGFAEITSTMYILRFPQRVLQGFNIESELWRINRQTLIGVRTDGRGEYPMKLTCREVGVPSPAAFR